MFSRSVAFEHLPGSTFGVLLSVLAASVGRAQSCTTERVNLGPNGVEANGRATQSRMSADGRWVAFRSAASNLVANDANGTDDAFVRDRVTGVTLCASVNLFGVPGNGYSAAWIDVAGDGKVVFDSFASDLVLNDANGTIRDVFVHDPIAHTTQLVSVSSAGTQPASASGFYAHISANGRYVLFSSAASNLATPPNPSLVPQVYVRDLVAQTTVRVSVAPDGWTLGNSNSETSDGAISADGRYVAFNSFASNLVVGQTSGFFDLYVRDMQTGTTTLAARAASSGQWGRGMSFSADGRYLGFWGRVLIANVPTSSVFVHDLQTASTENIGLLLDGTQASIWGGGLLSPDGRFVSFMSADWRLLPPTTTTYGDVFVFDRCTRVTKRASYGDQGQVGNNVSSVFDAGTYVGASIAADNRTIEFESLASNLVSSDANNAGDVFVRDCDLTAPQTYCTAKLNSLGCRPAIGYSGSPSASAGSGFIITATNILNHQRGYLLYGTSAPQAVAFQGGTLCVGGTLRRTRWQDSGGSAGTSSDCSGTLSFEFNAHIAGGADNALAYDAPVWAQYWSRDPNSPSGTNLTDAIAFVIEL